ncbi:MAG: hypothetical protein HUU35_18875 [Armatimonadetes bacterium]|nr:hypothetical protein [Armatimonadota bacterium]
MEIAIPWREIGGRPAAGSSRRANLCRQRRAVPELSCWSTTVSGFIEPARFGVWSF